MRPSIPAIHLYREGDKVFVAVEIGGRWVEVIRENWDSPFSHIVEPAGIQWQIDEAGLLSTNEEVIALADAMDQLLDDMGATGQSVCLYAKAKARIAFEPFRHDDDHANEFTLEEAKAIVEAYR